MLASIHLEPARLGGSRITNLGDLGPIPRGAEATTRLVATGKQATKGNNLAVILTSQTAAQQSRPNSSHYSNAVQSVRQGIPPTPPMTSETSFDGYNSPSNKSVSQLPATGYYFEATPPPGHMEMEPRPHMTSVSRVPVQAPFAQSAYSAPYGMAPSNPMAAYYPTMQPTPPPQQPQISSLYYQRPLPQVSTNSSQQKKYDYQSLTCNRPSLPCLSTSPWVLSLAPTRGSTTTTSHHLLRHLSLSPRTATSARPATRHSPARAP